MPEFARALVVILVLSGVAFTLARKPACEIAIKDDDFKLRRNLWFGITLTVFLAHNYWVYIGVAAVLLFSAAKRQENKLALFFALLFAAPNIPNEIGALGVVRYLFTIDYLRLLAITVLIPAFFALRARDDVPRFGSLMSDKFLIMYLVLQFFLILRASTLTNTLRLGFLIPFLGIFLPYYVASRYPRNLAQFRDIAMSLVVAALVLSLIGFFEFARHWLLYSTIEDMLDVNWKLGGGYLRRGEDLRATASTGQPIPLGYAITVALGFSFYLRKSVSDAKRWGLCMMILVAGLIAPLSRGPWLGAAGMLMFFLLSSQYAGRRIVQSVLVAIVGLPLLLISPFGETIIGYLPWVGEVDSHNVEYRELLIEQSLVVIGRNPWFGAYDYMYAKEFEDLASNSGFIDIVNTYVAIALSQGVLALAFFCGAFIVVGASIFRAMIRYKDKGSEGYLLGQVLLASLLATLITIGTVSSISVIPVIYWALLGLGAAYARIERTDDAAVPLEVDEKKVRPMRQKRRLRSKPSV